MDTRKGQRPPNKRKPETVENAAPMQRKTRNKNRGDAGITDWRSCDAAILQRAIEAITSNGYAVRLGYTRDGGAYAIGILGDGDPFTEYVRPTEDLDAYLKTLIEDYGR